MYVREILLFNSYTSGFAAKAGVPVANKPDIAASYKTPIDTLVNRLNNFFINLIIYIIFYEDNNFNYY